jgi:hypothetical protein
MKNRYSVDVADDGFEITDEEVEVDDDETCYDFDYYYDLSDDSDEYKWGEMSYYRFDRPTGWKGFELTELELFSLVKD